METKTNNRPSLDTIKALLLEEYKETISKKLDFYHCEYTGGIEIDQDDLSIMIDFTANFDDMDDDGDGGSMRYYLQVNAYVDILVLQYINPETGDTLYYTAEEKESLEKFLESKFYEDAVEEAERCLAE